MKAQSWRVVFVAVALASLSAALLVKWRFDDDMRVVRDRIGAASQVIRTAHGDIEFTTWGTGPPVLVVHGAGGGYDQGNLIAKAMGGEGFRWIIPSRFGYLRSSLPADASTAAQAAAFAELLDVLQISRVAVLAMSGGVPPSLQFAQAYPARVSALVLLSSAPFTPLTAAAQKLPVPAWAYNMLFSSDFPYWVLQKRAPSTLATIFDVSPAMQAQLTSKESGFVAAMIGSFQPVTQRVDGIRNEGSAIDPNARYRLEAIAQPTLVIHARDDGINPFAFGEYAAHTIRGATFMPLHNGGHLLLGHHAEVQTSVNAFLHTHGVAAPPA